MNIKDSALRTAVLKALRDAVDAELSNERTDTFEAVKQLYALTGSKSLDVRLPDGVKVASLSLTIPKAGPKVTDKAKFDKWLMKRYPSAVVKVPARREIASSFGDNVLANEVAFTPDGRALTAEGEIVPGVEYHEAGDPKTFSIRFEKGGRETIGAAWSNGEFAHLMPGMAPATVALPAAPDGGDA